MRTLTSGDDTVVCFDEKVWLQERNIIKFHHDGNANNTVTLYAGNTALATYSLDSTARVTIDVTDYLRTYPNTTLLKTVCSKDDETIEIPLQVVGLINPEQMIIPANADIARMPNNTAYIVPPKKMLQDMGLPIIFEMYCDDFDNLEVRYGSSASSGADAARSNTLPVGTTVFSYGDVNESLISRSLKNTYDGCDGSVGGAKYATVEWISATGATRRHVFEIRAVSTAVGDTISLETIDGSFNTIKGRTDGFTLVLEGLNNYDYWYYSDVITSSCVKVSLDGATWQQVDVTTKSVSFQDGNAGDLQKLEVQVTYKQYDAFAL